jgi:D-3-phosphoglycerate dehydrogenase / 2-oxoglutarate reductase
MSTDRGYRSGLKIVNVEPDGYSAEARALLEGIGSLCERRPRNRQELLAAVSDADVLITRLGHRIDSDIFYRADRLSAVVSATTGLDHIDVAAAARRNVSVISLLGEREFLNSIHATAEHAWGLLLAAVRRVPSAYASVIDGKWDRDAFRGQQLFGKRLGILGLGRLGQKVARYGLAFGMRVHAYDPNGAEMDGVTLVQTLENLLTISDIISLHAPHNDSTHHMIGTQELRMLPSGAIVINTARGGLLDEDALVAALISGRVSAVGVDVLEFGDVGSTERQGLSPLITYAKEHSNVVVTPHIGGATFESMDATEVFMARKLIKFIEDRA